MIELLSSFGIVIGILMVLVMLLIMIFIPRAILFTIIITTILDHFDKDWIWLIIIFTTIGLAIDLTINNMVEY